YSDMSCSSSDETYEESPTSHHKLGHLSSDEIASTSTAGLGDCVVCAHPAHGLHFGVLACRACAAFYRRTVVLSKQYACRRANKTCAINKEERYLCRYCRYQKCLAVGMQADNVQWNRDKVLSERMKAQAAARIPGQDPPPLTPAAQHRYGFDSKQPEEVHKEFFPAVRFFKKPDETPAGLSHPANANLLLDIGPVIVRVASLFENPPLMPDIGIRMTLMQRMLVGLRHVRRNQNRTPVVESFISAARGKTIWERQLYAIAEWAMHCEEFAQLPGDQKLAVYKGSWAAFYRLERFHLTVSVFGRALLEKGLDKSMILILTDDIAVDFLTTDFDFTFITDYDQQEVKNMFQPFCTRLYEEVARPMIELQITNTELVYMLGQLTWHLEGRKGIAPETLAISESFRARISNELHDYYVYELKMNNYAARLMKLMGIVNDVENILYERNKVLELARIFDVFKIDLQDPGRRAENLEVTAYAGFGPNTGSGSGSGPGPGSGFPC
ncbi:hypothetical protein PENTCL1PPCAC_3634, partial [Pristionchus entomophagus]